MVFRCNLCHLSDASHNSEAYSESCHISMREQFVKIANSGKPLTIFAKYSILDVWQGSENASVISEFEELAFTSSGKPVTDHINLASKEPSQ